MRSSHEPVDRRRQVLRIRRSNEKLLNARAHRTQHHFRISLRRGPDDRGVPLSPDLTLEGSQLQVGHAIERDDREVDVLLAKVLDGRVHVIHSVEFRETEPRENFRREFFGSSRATYQQRLTCHTLPDA